MKELKPQKKRPASPVIRELRGALQDSLKQRLRVSGNIKIKIDADRIFVWCRKAISPLEVHLGNVKVGRLLLQEVSERRCREVRSELGRLLYRITALRLIDICVAIFYRRREKVYVLAMSDTLG
jgi:hypothetical protein